MIEAWAIATWRTVGGRNEPNAALTTYEDIAGTLALNLPPNINLGAWHLTAIPDKATLDALDAATGVIVLSAVDNLGATVAGYLRPQDTPTGAQLSAAKTRLQNAGIPTAFLTANITVGMTLAQIANVLRAWAHDLLHG
jgi:hypothetical protein